MMRNESGSALLVLLFVSTVCSLVLFGSLPYVQSAHQVAGNDWGKLQAQYNAEAGVWLAIEDWKNSRTAFTGRSYPLFPGTAEVSLNGADASLLEIVSEGTMPPHFADAVKVKYDPAKDEIVEWTRLK